MNPIRNTIIASLALAGMASPAFAAERGTAASNSRNTSAAVARSDDSARDDQRICVRDTPTGSRIARMVCHTRTDWQRRYFAVPGEER